MTVGLSAGRSQGRCDEGRRPLALPVLLVFRFPSSLLLVLSFIPCSYLVVVGLRFVLSVRFGTALFSIPFFFI